MAKSATPGQLRTKIAVQECRRVTNENGYDEEVWKNVFGPGYYVVCKWVNVHGSEAFTAKQLGLIEPATLTMRYTGRVTPACRIFKYNDPVPFEIISINNVQDMNKWLEIKVQRKVEAI